MSSGRFHVSVNDQHVPSRAPAQVAGQPPELAILELNRTIFLRPRDPKLFAVRSSAFSRLHDLLWPRFS